MPRFTRTATLAAGGLALALGLASMGGGVAVAAGGGLAPPAVDPAVVHAPTTVPDRVILTPTTTPATSQSISWRTSTAATSPQVQWAVAGPTVVAPAAITTVAAATNTTFASNLGYDVAHHSATIDGLAAETTYLYRVGDGAAWGEWLEFTTASAAPAPFSFLVQGDAQNDNKAFTSRTFRAAFEARPYARVVVHAGDLVDTETSDAEWGEWHEAAAFSNQYLNVVAATGNHEYYPGPDLSRYWQAQFEYPKNGPAAVPTLSETVYFVDYQGVRFISLDSTQAMGEENRAAQTAWLEGVLADNPNDWTVVTFHHPVFSVTSGRDNATIRESWLPLFERFGVDLVVQGHDHAYGRGNLIANEQGLPAGVDASKSYTGPTYLVSVAGPKMYIPDPEDANNWTANDARLRVMGRDVQLFQTVDVTADGRMHVEARTVDGAIFDSFTIAKGADGTKVTTDAEMWDGGAGSTRDGVAPPAVPNPEPSTPNPEPSTPNPEPSTPNPEPSTPNPEPSTPNPEPPTVPEAAVPTVALTDASVAPGGSLSLTGTGFVGGERVAIELHSDPVTLGLTTAREDGAVAATVTIPQDTVAGEHSLVLTGLDSGRSVRADIVVTASGTAAAATLPRTGGELPTGLIAAGGILAAAGGALVVRTLLRNRKVS